MSEQEFESFLDFLEDISWLSLTCIVITLLFAICMPFLDALKFFLISNVMFNAAIIAGGWVSSLTGEHYDY